jgi:hypothetical protein
MPFWFSLVMMLLFSAVPAAAVWAMIQTRPRSVRISLSTIMGMAPLSFLGWMVYRSKTGNGNLNPLNFVCLMIGVSLVCALLAIFAMEWRLRHR